ncbi:MAG: hypothetical protein ACXACI_06095 [Candidatus Hodarchaeales archaeon]|jgi:hypothetical protein
MGNPPDRSSFNPSRDLKLARTHILSGELPEMLLSKEKHQFIALQLFRAVDQLSFKGIKGKEIVKNAQYLRWIQDTLLSQDIDQSLELYSEGFVLGALVNALHRFEANINTTKKYDTTLGLLRTWRERLSDSDMMTEFLDDALLAAEELSHWGEARSKALLPIGLEILDFFVEMPSLSADEALGRITEAREEKELFHFLAGSLQTKPSLHQAIHSECIAHEIRTETFLAFLEQMMEQLKTAAKDGDVRGLASLFWTGYASASPKKPLS